jgi:hypothetical protein
MSPAKSDFHQPNTNSAPLSQHMALPGKLPQKKTKTSIIIFLNSYFKLSTKLFFCTIFGILLSKKKLKKRLI